jgi:hypothetical protein
MKPAVKYKWLAYENTFEQAAHVIIAQKADYHIFADEGLTQDHR